MAVALKLDDLCGSDELLTAPLDERPGFMTVSFLYQLTRSQLRSEYRCGVLNPDLLILSDMFSLYLSTDGLFDLAVRRSRE